MFTHIVAAYDGSENADRALEAAVELRRLSGGKLTILTIYRHHSKLEASLSMIGRIEDGRSMDDVMREHAFKVAESGKQKAFALGAEEARAFVRGGPVARGIVGFASERGADAIVLGSRGLGSIDGYLLGSISHKVTGTAPCPVLVV